MIALLAPVCESHLKSGLATEKIAGKVAFGCSARHNKLQRDADVFICATPCSDSDPAVSWHATFIGYTPAVDGGVHPDGMKYRPETTRGEKGWQAFWEVTNLKELPTSECMRIRKFISFRTGKPYQPYVPQRPYLIQLPA